MKHSACVLLPVLAVIMAVTIPAVAAGTGSMPKVRKVTNLDRGWAFHKGDIPGAASASLNDSQWEQVDLPHTWNADDGQDGAGYWRGTSWYRKHLTIGRRGGNKRFFIRFKGANIVTDVYVNGVHVGQHRGGYSAFCYELSRFIEVGGSNVVAVRVDNEEKRDVAPITADFTFYGGLYRGVELIATDRACISPTDYASPGVYLKQAHVSREEARVEILTKVSNGHAQAKELSVRAIVFDAAGREVASTVSSAEVPTGVTEPFHQEFRLARPHLWNGLKDPYLYTVRVELVREGAVVDLVEQPLGLRFFHVDPDKGFFLNGDYLDLRGVNRHQDRLGKGNAIGMKEHARDLSLIREIGATSIRLAHYQHAEQFYDLCDKAGMVVWAEIPLVNEITESPDFYANAKQQMVELIRQNYNHPSICFWGVANEITHYMKRQDYSVDPLRLVGELNALARAEDPTRPTVIATNSSTHPSNLVTDLVAWNKYYGWYGGGVNGALGRWADAYHAEHPEACIGVSEYGAGANILQHEQDPEQPEPRGHWHPEEWQNTYHESSWKQMRDRPFLWCKYVWNMFDFGSDTRNEGGNPGRNDKGLVTFDRKVKKDAFYWYKANWSEEPVLYITSRRHTERTERVTGVKVYTNCDSVALRVNGKLIGEAAPEGCIAAWSGIKLRRGANEIAADGKKGGKTLTDACSWEYLPNNMQE